MISEVAKTVCEQSREPERRITRNLKSTSTAAARLRWSLSVWQVWHHDAGTTTYLI